MCQGPVGAAPWISALCAMYALAQRLSPVCDGCWRAAHVVPSPSGKVSWKNLRIPTCFTALVVGLCREVIYVILHTTNQPGSCCLQWRAMQDHWVYFASLGKKTLGRIPPNASAAEIYQHAGCALLHSPRGIRGTPLKKLKTFVPFSFLVASFLGTPPAVEKLILYPFHLLPPPSLSFICALLLSSPALV